MDERHDVLLVGVNTDKHEAYALKRDKQIVRVAQGVYFRTGKDAEVLFELYGIRLAKFCFQSAALTHSTAWYRKPVDGRVFLGGDYPYKKSIAPYEGDFRIVQSMVHPKLTDERMYELAKFEDPLGQFETKKNVEKHLPEQEMDKIFEQLQLKYGSKASTLAALETIAQAAEKTNEFERLLKHFFSQRRRS
jgi:hypothetical protein